jgi:hypothetical protein
MNKIILKKTTRFLAIGGTVVMVYFLYVHYTRLKDARTLSTEELVKKYTAR